MNIDLINHFAKGLDMVKESLEQKKEPIYPAQCKCGHLFLERYKFPKPLEDGTIGFCWCGFCRTRVNVKNP